jgi:hypothetical protein
MFQEGRLVSKQRSAERSADKQPIQRSRQTAGARDNASGGLRAMLLTTMGQILAAPIIGMLAGFLLLFGGIFLAVAWTAGPQPLIDSYHYAPFTAQVSGRIVESWTALDFDPDDLPKGKSRWQPYSKIAPCVVVEYDGEWGAPMRRGLCGNRFQFREDFRLDDWRTMAPGVPFAFQRDASGFAVEEIRLGKTALDWLSAHPPYDTFMLSKPPPTTALAALKEQFDHPLDVAIASWTTPFPQFPLAYDPRHPEEVMPARLVDDRKRGFWWGGLVFTVLLAVPGVFVWRIGMNFLTGQSGWLLWLLTLAPMLALPWWSEVLPKLLRHANRNWADVGNDMLDDVTRVTRFSAGAPADVLQAGGERLLWHVESGMYADTWGRVRYSIPLPPPATPESALAELRTQASEQLRKLNSSEQAALFVRLRQQYEADARQVQSVFWTAAEDTLRDANADSAAHRAAKNFLIFASGGDFYEDQLDALEKSAGQAGSAQ